MSKDIEYEQKIETYDYAGVFELWQAVQSGDTPGWESGKALEYLILRAFQLEGADIRWPYNVRIRGQEIEQIDGIVYADGIACMIECKDQKDPSNVEPLTKLRSQLLRRPVITIGSVFSSSGFTEPASTLAAFFAPQTILLWNNAEMSYALEKHAMCQAMHAKYRFCIEEGFPDFDITKQRTFSNA